MAIQSGGWRDHLIRAQIARSRAFKDYLTALRAREFSSDLPRELLSFYDAVNDGIVAKLQDLRGDLLFRDFGDDAAEVHLVRYSELYQFLYSVTSDLEHVEASRTIVEFSPLLHRLALPHSKDLRLVLHALPEVNYSWADPVSLLRDIARQLEISVDESPPSRNVWSIGFPGLQPGQTLVHTLLSHELGHGIVHSESSLGSLRAQVRISAERIKALVQGVPPGVPRAPVRRFLRRYLNRVLGKWVDEIACDVIGYTLTGPAFLFASIHFLPALAALDSASQEYPSIRLRLSLLFRLLKAELGYSPREVCTDAQYEQWFIKEGAARFLGEWDRHINADAPPYGDNPHDIVAEAIDQSFEALLQAIGSKVQRLRRYRFTDHRDQVRQLVGRLDFSVPPNELDQPPRAVADAVCIMNAGWIAYLSLVEPLSSEHGWDEWTTRSRIEEWVAKALELQEVQRRWDEVSSNGG